MANIKTYARIKPGPKLYPEYKTTEDTVTINTTSGYSDWPGNSLRNGPSDRYKFSHVFPHDSSQEQIFGKAAKDIVEAFLNGYNGTIFAYGQTGSGKTYTMEGSARQYKDRGLAPRAISMIYNALAGQKDADNTIHMSYLEIYQEVGYDLLNPAARNSSTVTPFPKVVVLDCMGGSCLVKNLSSHLAASEAVAQSLLLQGQANRKVAETPMNQRSSRSHAVLTVQLTSRKAGSDIITRSKLHLVDLAGSERVAKTRIEGVQLTEAKFINLSLHHLEGVIIALQHEGGGKSGGKSVGPWTKNKHYKSYSPYNMQWGKQTTSSFSMTRRPSEGSDIYQTSKHIPYRNSLLTMVLKDSLGGNCMTAMIATLSLEYSNLGETLSTCRFAQRVACITNQVRKNEEIDDKSLIRQLQRRIGHLEAELTLVKLGQASSETNEETVTNSKLTDEDKIFCEDLMREFVAGKVKNPLSQGISTPQLFCQCLKSLKELIVNHVCQNNSRIVTTNGTMSKPDRPVVLHPSASADDLKKIIAKEEKQEIVVLTRRPASSSGPSVSRQRTSTDPFRDERTSGDRPPSGSSSKGKYKTPYEKKREKEIKKLNDKIEKAFNTQQDEEQQIQDWKVQIKQEQLAVLMKEISHKAEQTREQLASQHAYILKLKHEGADPDVIKQEKIAEKQLKKRDAKIERRLQHVKLKMDQAKSTDDQNRPASGQTRPKSVEEKYGRLRKSDGTLNTRQVLEKLHLEERKHHVKESKLQQQRINTVAEELELRETATRQKLLEFKEKLRLFRESRDSPSMFNSSDKMFNSSGYASLPLSDLSGLNTTDADKHEMLASFAEQRNHGKPRMERHQNGDATDKEVASAFKPYKGSAKIVPKSGWLYEKSDVQNDYINKHNKTVQNGHLENGADLVEFNLSEVERNILNLEKKKNGLTGADSAFTHDSRSKQFNEMNVRESQKVTSGIERENYPFIKAALRDHGNPEERNKMKETFDSDNNSGPVFSKPPLPNRQESVTNGFNGDTGRQHQSTVDRWNNVYSPSSSRPSTGDKQRSSSLPPKSGEKQIPISEKWNSGTSSRPSSGNSIDFFSSIGDTGTKWDTSYRTTSPIDSWSGVRPTDILRTKSASPKDFAQSYDTEGVLADIPFLLKSHSFDINANNEDSNLLKEFSKTRTKAEVPCKHSDKTSSKQHKRERHIKKVTSFGDFRDSTPPPVTRSVSFPEPVSNRADDTFSPSQVNTRNDLDLCKMSLRDKGFDSMLNSMLNDGHDVKGMKNADVKKKTKRKSELFDVLLRSKPTDDDDPPSQRIQAYKEEEREPKYMEKARYEKERVARIRRVRSAAETIQKFWRRYCERK